MSQGNTANKPKSKKQKEYSTLLAVISSAATNDARAILRKYSGEDATDVKDLQQKLAQTWKYSAEKLDMEKDIAKIHPHKDFILKYNQPAPIDVPAETPKPEEKVIKQVVVHDGLYENFESHAPCGDPTCKKCNRYFSSCDGNKSCNCNKTSSACGCGSSSFNGGGYSGADGQSSKSIDVTVVAVVGIVALVTVVVAGLIIYKHEKK